MLKRRRSIQRTLDEQVLEEALTEANLEESIMDADIIEREQEIFGTRRRTIRLEMGIASARKRIRLQTLEARVESALDRLNYAKDSLAASVIRRVKLIEDEFTHGEATHEEALRSIDQEEEAMQASIGQRRQERLIFRANDAENQDQIVARIQAAETDDPDSISDDDEGQEEEEEDE